MRPNSVYVDVDEILGHMLETNTFLAFSFETCIKDLYLSTISESVSLVERFLGSQSFHLTMRAIWAYFCFIYISVSA